MKISRLYIDKFKHLENLTFDFTYQSGDRKGQPLDKICFIGQSATGKTGLLDLIYDCSKSVLNLETVNGNGLIPNLNINPGSETAFIINGEPFFQNDKEVIFRDRIYKESFNGGIVDPLISPQDKTDVFYFKANLISDKNIEYFAKNPIDLIEKHGKELQNIIGDFKHNETSGMIFDKEVQLETWLYLLNEILEYRKNFTQKMSELIHKGLLADHKKLSSEFQKWQKENPNKLASFAEKFNPLLEKLFLEVDLVNTEYSIPIKNKKNDEIIPIQHTSTGTKGLLLSFLPIFKLDTQGSIILIDEPERSLFPDMQMDLMDYYKNAAPDAQFIVATHSPFIAAAFEPDERFILYFDESGKVAVRRGSSPIGDDPNDILHNDFGLNQLINKTGQEIYNDYLEKKRQMHFEKSAEKKKQLQQEIEEIGDKYNF